MIEDFNETLSTYTLTGINEYWDKLILYRDPRTDIYPLMDNPWPTWYIIISYLVFVFLIGPRIMRNRQPFEIKKLLFVYNFCLVVLSLYMVYNFLIAGWATTYTWGCDPVDYSSNPQSLLMVKMCWLFFFSKLIELFDTIFFVLRKKNRQISFLHVFHHSIMPLSWWYGVKFVPGGFGTFHALLNSIVHVVMYTYYGISSLGPKYQKYIWWKKYMTVFQMVQFVLVMIHSSQLLFMNCYYPTLFIYWIASYAIAFFMLFSNFFFVNYLRKKSVIKRE
ncbi:hypothetical protein SNEBB_005127 [Seison nebaliae]|nr:hypothetical protein SNEBB_005127 [Seison nebaliae]